MIHGLVFFSYNIFYFWPTETVLFGFGYHFRFVQLNDELFSWLFLLVRFIFWVLCEALDNLMVLMVKFNHVT